MNSRNLKKHLKYIIPEMRLALIKGPGGNPLPINCPDDVHSFVCPLLVLCSREPSPSMSR